MTPAQQFGRELDKAIKARGYRVGFVANGIGIKTETLASWRKGERLAQYALAMTAADFLMWPALGRLITKLRTYTCARCGREFINNHNIGIYCSSRCRTYLHDLRKRRSRSDDLKVRTGRLLAVWQDVGDRMCREWCPNDGLCPDASCPIQVGGLCPLPLAKERAA